MVEFAAFGYAGLFLAAFLAATLLPVASEPLMVYMLNAGASDGLVLFWATAGNVLGAVVNYGIGYRGSPWLLHKVLRMDDAQIARAGIRFRRWGAPSMLLAWAPVIGDPLTVVAGMFRLPFSVFLPLVTAGKLARYALLVAGWRMW